MGLFGPKYDRRTAHDRTDRITSIHGRKDFNTGSEIADRIGGKIKGYHITNRKLLQQNIYRVYRGKGYGVWEAYKIAKAKAAEIMLNQGRKQGHRNHHRHR
jgi:hypothetical protein